MSYFGREEPTRILAINQITGTCVRRRKEEIQWAFLKYRNCESIAGCNVFLHKPQKSKRWKRTCWTCGSKNHISFFCPSMIIYDLNQQIQELKERVSLLEESNKVRAETKMKRRKKQEKKSWKKRRKKYLEKIKVINAVTIRTFLQKQGLRYMDMITCSRLMNSLREIMEN